MDLNEQVLEPIIFDDEPLEGSSSIPTDGATNLGLGTKEEEDGGEGNGSDADYEMEEDY